MSIFLFSKYLLIVRDSTKFIFKEHRAFHHVEWSYFFIMLMVCMISLQYLGHFSCLCNLMLGIWLFLVLGEWIILCRWLNALKKTAESLMTNSIPERWCMKLCQICIHCFWQHNSLPFFSLFLLLFTLMLPSWLVRWWGHGGSVACSEGEEGQPKGRPSSRWFR